MPFSKAVEVAMSDIDWVGDEDLQEAHRSINIRCDEADAGLVDAHRSINIRCKTLASASRRRTRKAGVGAQSATTGTPENYVGGELCLRVRW